MKQTRLTGRICFKYSRFYGGMILWVQEVIEDDAPTPYAHWRKATAEDIAELEIHSMISEL